MSANQKTMSGQPADLGKAGVPLCMPARELPADWVDYNGHITESRYLQLCGSGADHLLTFVGIDADYRSQFGSYYTLETHLCHLGELHAGDRVEVSTQILGTDDKRLHIFHVITREGGKQPVATGEQMLIHVSAATRRSGPVQGSVRERLIELTHAHEQLPRPDRAGAAIGFRKSAG